MYHTFYFFYYFEMNSGYFLQFLVWINKILNLKFFFFFNFRNSFESSPNLLSPYDYLNFFFYFYKMFMIPVNEDFAVQVLLLVISSSVVYGALFLYMFLWFYFTMRCSLYLDILYVENFGVWSVFLQNRFSLLLLGQSRNSK